MRFGRRIDPWGGQSLPPRLGGGFFEPPELLDGGRTLGLAGGRFGGDALGFGGRLGADALGLGAGRFDGAGRTLGAGRLDCVGRALAVGRREVDCAFGAGARARVGRTVDEGRRVVGGRTADVVRRVGTLTVGVVRPLRGFAFGVDPRVGEGRTRVVVTGRVVSFGRVERVAFGFAVLVGVRLVVGTSVLVSGRLPARVVVAVAPSRGTAFRGFSLKRGPKSGEPRTMRSPPVSPRGVARLPDR